MAGEKLQQFEALKETDKNSLSAQEKANLNKVSERDYRQAVTQVESKTFKVDGFKVNGKDPTLKDIVNKLTFSSDGGTAYLNGKAIESTSELGAALQVLVIANDFSVGGDKIDGTVGKNSIDGLQKLKNKYRATPDKPQTPTTPETNPDEFRVQNVDALVNNADYTAYVGVYKNENYRLLKTDGTGKLRDARYEGTKVTIKYKSNIGDKEMQTIVVDAKTCKKGNGYSIDAFGKEIAKTIKANEDKLQKDLDAKKAQEKLDAENKSITDGINNFNEGAISDKLIKKYFAQDTIPYVHNPHNISCVRINGDAVTIKNDIDNSTVVLSRSDLLKNGKFNSKNYEDKLKSVYENKALTYVKGEVNKSIDGWKSPASILNVSACDTAIRDAKALKNEVAGFGRADKFTDEMNKIDTKLDGYNKQKDYLAEKNNKQEALDEINKLSGSNNQNFEKNFDQILEEMKRIVVINRDKNDMSKFTIDYATKGRTKFKAVNKDSEYLAFADTVVKKLQNVKSYGVPLFKINVVGR